MGEYGILLELAAPLFPSSFPASNPSPPPSSLFRLLSTDFFHTNPYPASHHFPHVVSPPGIGGIWRRQNFPHVQICSGACFLAHSSGCAAAPALLLIQFGDICGDLHWVPPPTFLQSSLGCSLVFSSPLIPFPIFPPEVFFLL